ncbi:hypothetical protein DFH07DRAFT_959633 [Mycena maculata]|uniref:Uncharacterized protein n=1 Tax=Mycena maculata TaxID=230809 RepID=A0AAD7J1E5_9AGAR|nr:hypothetical protein DFH07DRAFT_959633 [Mycena maculata]
MLIKLTPPASATPTPTILFALAFPDLPLNLPVPPAWAAQLARLSADDLEAPPALHALDRAAALPSLLQEVLFDIPAERVSCTFLDGAVEAWTLDARCADMLASVIQDVEESGRAEERAREWQRVVEEERARAVQTSQAEVEREQEERERERGAELERDYERELQRAKGKGREQALNSPPTSIKSARPKSRLTRSRSLLMALVATFSNNSSPSALCSTSSVPAHPASAPATRSSFSASSPRSPSPLRTFARRASFSALSSAASASLSPKFIIPPPPSTSPPLPPPPPHDLETPPGSAPPSAPSSAFAKQQEANLPLPLALVSVRAQREAQSPRALRRRARSTLVDAFRAHVLPELSARVRFFEGAGGDYGGQRDEDQTAKPGAGGGYHAWVARSMLRRAESRMRELEGEFPALARPRGRHASELSAGSRSPQSPSYPPFSPISPTGTGFFAPSPSPSPSPRHATFEPWSSSEGSDVSDSGDEGDEGDSVFEGAQSETESDGSSVHTPESGHGGGHVLDVSTSTTSSYFTCSDATEFEAGKQEQGQGQEQEQELNPTPSHIRGAAQSSPVHSRANSTSRPRRASTASRQARRDQRERKRVARAAKAEHLAFARMTARLRALLAQGAAMRGLVRMQRDEGDRVREARGVRRACLDGRRAKMGSGDVQVQVQVFRPSGLGRGVWGPADVVYDEFEEGSSGSGSPHGDEMPPAYEDVVALGFQQHSVHRTRTSQPISRTRSTLAHLDDLELEVDLEHLELDPAELEGLDIDVALEHLDFTDVDVEGMGIDLDVEFREVDMFADVSNRGRGKGMGRRGPVSGVGRRDAWGRRRLVPL